MKVLSQTEEYHCLAHTVLLSADLITGYMNHAVLGYIYSIYDLKVLFLWSLNIYG